MSEAVVEKLSTMSLDTIYISEKTGDDTTGTGTQEKPYKTALYALREHTAEPLPKLMVDVKEDKGEMECSSSQTPAIDESVLVKLDQHFLTHSYIEGFSASVADKVTRGILAPHHDTFTEYTNLKRWFNHVQHITKHSGSLLPSTLDVVSEFHLADPQPFEPMAKSQLKKVTNLWKQDQRKRERNRQREEKDAQNSADLLERAAKVVITQDLSLPAATLVERLSDASKYRDTRVMVKGWVQHLRKQSAQMMFITVRDGYGFLQCVLLKELCLTTAAITLNTEATVCLYGRLQAVPEGKTAPGGHELHVDYWELIANAPPGGLENQINKDSHPDVQLDKRHLLIRGENASKVLKLRSILKESFVDHYRSRHYRWMDPPAIVQAPCEGGSELFELDFFGQKATLTQSSQLYLETCIASLGKVYCMEKSFRAEPSKTRRHLASYLHVEAEEAFITFDQLLDMLEDLVCDVVARVVAHPEGSVLVKELNPGFVAPQRPFLRMAYADAIKYLDEHDIRKPDGTKYEFGEDIPEMPERKMTDAINRPILLHSFPASIKAFYMQRHPENPELTESVDLLMPGVGEIVGGSMRMWDPKELMAAFEKEGLPVDPYQWYMDQRIFGSCPHGGYGLGLERFLCWLSDTHHIRDACLYPRFVGRAYP